MIMLKLHDLLRIYHSHGPYKLVLQIAETLIFYWWVEVLSVLRQIVRKHQLFVTLMCSINKSWKIGGISQNRIRKIHVLKSTPLLVSSLCCWFLTIDFSHLFFSFSRNKASTTSLGNLFHWEAVITRIHFNAYTLANPSLKLAHHQYYVMTTDKTKLYKSHWD